MIERYTRPQMGHIWSLENKFEVWKEIEVLACEAQAELGRIGITKEEAAWIREHADFNKDEVDAIKKETGFTEVSQKAKDTEAQFKSELADLSKDLDLKDHTTNPKA